MGYLRFRPEEFQAIWRACAPIDLSDDFFAVFKYFLIESLSRQAAALAQRVAQLSRRELRILYEHLRERKKAGRPRRGRPGDGGPPGRGELSAEEVEAVARVCRPFVFHQRFLGSFRAFLVRILGKTEPELARKLTRLSERQIERLYEQVKRRRRDNA
jgi:hypothetical protein